MVSSFWCEELDFNLDEAKQLVFRSKSTSAESYKEQNAVILVLTK